MVTDWWRRRPPVVQDLLAGGAVALAWFTAFYWFRQHGWSPRQPETFVVAGIWTAAIVALRRVQPAWVFAVVVVVYPIAYGATLQSEFHLLAGAGGRVHGDELGAGPPRRGVDRLHGGEPRPLLEPPVPGRPRPCARRPPLRLAQRALHRAGDGERGGARVAHAPAGRDLPRPRPAQRRARAPASRRGPTGRRPGAHARRTRAARRRRPPPDCRHHPGAGR